jgi:hypothetical protein
MDGYKDVPGPLKIGCCLPVQAGPAVPFPTFVNFDGFAKSRWKPASVIPVKTGIQYF